MKNVEFKNKYITHSHILVADIAARCVVNSTQFFLTKVLFTNKPLTQSQLLLFGGDGEVKLRLLLL